MELPPPPPPERSKRLHNFTLPHLRWGQQKYLRCVKLQHHRSPSPDHAAALASHAGGVGEFGSGNGKLKLDLIYDGKPKVTILENGGEETRNCDVAAAAARPWNLRTRRAACNEPGDEPARITESSLRRHHDSNKNEKVKFSVSLLREEIEEDFTALLGKKPPRRPKKRPRLVQKQMNTLFPGLWLPEEVTAESYNVPEAMET